MLVDGKLSFGEVRRGIFLAFGVSSLLLCYLLTTAPDPAPLGVSLLVLAALALGYTVPPLKLSHRGLGELVVAFTHSIGVVLPGYLLQGGDLHDPLPWLLSLPLGLAVLPAIVLSGVPDYDADAAAGKNTLVVKLGIRGALIAATLLPILTMAATLVCRQLPGVAGAYGYWIYLAVPHAAWLIWQLGKCLWHRRAAERIDGLMVLALTFILWFGAIPLIRLW